jgi:hypothetical protein
VSLKNALTFALRYNGEVNRDRGCINGTDGVFRSFGPSCSPEREEGPLIEIDVVAPWEEFRLALEQVWRKVEELFGRRIFFWRFTNGFTVAGVINRTSCPRSPIARPQ